MQGIQTNLHTLPPPPAYRGMTAPASGLQYAAKTAQEWSVFTIRGCKPKSTESLDVGYV